MDSDLVGLGKKPIDKRLFVLEGRLNQFADAITECVNMYRENGRPTQSLKDGPLETWYMKSQRSRSAIWRVIELTQGFIPEPYASEFKAGWFPGVRADMAKAMTVMYRWFNIANGSGPPTDLQKDADTLDTLSLAFRGYSEYVNGIVRPMQQKQAEIRTVPEAIPAVRKDGPCEPNLFVYNRNESTTEPIPLKLLCFMWNPKYLNDGKGASLTDIETKVWGGNMSEKALKAALGRLNNKCLLEVKFPKQLRLKSGKLWWAT